MRAIVYRIGFESHSRSILCHGSNPFRFFSSYGRPWAEARADQYEILLLDFVDDRLNVADFFGNLDDMAVMSQVDRLTAPADPLHQMAGGTCSILIEGLENVITKEG